MRSGIKLQIEKAERVNRSRADRQSAIVLTTINALNESFLKDHFIAVSIDKGSVIYDVTWHSGNVKRITGMLLGLFLEVETDPVFIYAYIDTWAQEFLEHLRNGEKRQFWQEILEYTTAVLNSADFDEEMYEQADSFFNEVKKTIEINRMY